MDSLRWKVVLAHMPVIHGTDHALHAVTLLLELLQYQSLLSLLGMDKPLICTNECLLGLISIQREVAPSKGIVRSTCRRRSRPRWPSLGWWPKRLLNINWFRLIRCWYMPVCRVSW